MKAIRRLLDRWGGLYWDDHVGCDPPARVRWRTRLAWRIDGCLETLTAISWVLRGSARDFDDWSLSFPLRCFYRAKTAVCLVVGSRSQRGDGVGYRSELDAECVTWFGLEQYGTPDGPGGSCTEVLVGVGLLSNWYAFTREESWP